MAEVEEAAPQDFPGFWLRPWCSLTTESGRKEKVLRSFPRQEGLWSSY